MSTCELLANIYILRGKWYDRCNRLQKCSSKKCNFKTAEKKMLF